MTVAWPGVERGIHVGRQHRQVANPVDIGFFRALRHDVLDRTSWISRPTATIALYNPTLPIRGSSARVIWNDDSGCQRA